MSDKFDPKSFTLDADKYGYPRVWYRDVEIRPWTHGVQGGRGRFFNIDNEFFVKAGGNTYGSQCRTETHKYAKIESKDLQYFTELLYSCDYTTNIHWNVWRYVELEKFYRDTREQRKVFDRCADIVFELCMKYSIADVINYHNGNWWIHNDEPLIVDLGC